MGGFLNKQMILSVKEQAEEWLFPRRGPVCLDIAVPPGAMICAACGDKLPLVEEPMCKKCGKPLEQAEKEYCRDCSRYLRAFERGIALMPYSHEIVHRLMMRVKYKNARQLLDYPCALMGERYRSAVGSWNIQALIPVPLHPSRRRMRGFNQAAEIADRLGKSWNIPVDGDLLFRVRNTTPQKELDSMERWQNLKGAFAVAGDWGTYERVMLVDDIYTTGNTAQACAAALLESGIDRVYLAVLAIGRDPH